MRLEKLMRQMEKQEEYSQVQRTRLEHRIAKLELELKEAQQAHRYVKHKAAPVVGFKSYGLETFLDHSPAKSGALYAFQSKLNPPRQRYDMYPVSGRLKTQEQISMNTYSCIVPMDKLGNSVGHVCKRHLEREYACREFQRKRTDLEKYKSVKKVRESSKRGYPIYKWLLKPFFRENSSQLAHKRQTKYSELGEEHRNRHKTKSMRTVNHALLHESSHFVCSSQHYQA